MSVYVLLMLQTLTIVTSCPSGGQVTPWNEDISTIPAQIASWLHHPDGKVQQSGRFVMERGVFTFGNFIGNLPIGLAWQSRSGRKMEGFLYGKVDQNGEFTGNNITFIYPDFLTGLRGSFAAGVLRHATAVDIVAERCYKGVKELKIELSDHNKHVVWEREQTNLTYIGKNRKAMDPYERKSVYIGMSSKPNSKEGLFARRKFLPGDIVSYYGGQKLFEKDKIFKNMTVEEKYEAAACHLALWRIAPNWLGHPHNLLVDVSKRYRSIVEYRTTLGHKANHSFDNNVEYWFVDHPVLGGIACLVAETEIDVDEEVFAHYRYGNINLPWYNEEFNHVYGARSLSRKKPC
jgi:hypothetical protein